MGAQGYLRRLTRRLTEDLEQRDVEELSDEVLNAGAQRAIDCQRGQEVTVVGTLRSVETNGKGCSGGVRAELFDDRHAGVVGSTPDTRHRHGPYPAGARPAGQAGKWDEGYLQPALRNSAVTIRQSELPVSRER